MPLPDRSLAAAIAAFLALAGGPGLVRAQSQSEFEGCLTRLQPAAQRSGVRSDSFSRYTEGVQADFTLLDKLNYQPEFKLPIWDYLSGLVDDERIADGMAGLARHADVLLVTGPVTRQMESRLRRVYAQTPEPKVVMVIGNCGVEGDVFYESYNLVGPVDQIVPVDVYVHGCPPRPEAIIDGVVKAWLKLEGAVKEKAA